MMMGQRRYVLRQSMRQRVDEKERDALTATGEGFWRLIRDPHRDVPAKAILIRNRTEETVVHIAKRKDVTRRWSASSLGT
jgi:hypothetical protein